MMYNKILTLCSALILASCLFIFSSCGEDPDGKTSKNTIVIGNESYPIKCMLCKRFEIKRDYGDETFYLLQLFSAPVDKLYQTAIWDEENEVYRLEDVDTDAFNALCPMVFCHINTPYGISGTYEISYESAYESESCSLGLYLNYDYGNGLFGKLEIKENNGKYTINFSGHTDDDYKKPVSFSYSGKADGDKIIGLG